MIYRYCYRSFSAGPNGQRLPEILQHNRWAQDFFFKLKIEKKNKFLLDVIAYFSIYYDNENILILGKVWYRKRG